jgi:hypothetical protein
MTPHPRGPVRGSGLFPGPPGSGFPAAGPGLTTDAIPRTARGGPARAAARRLEGQPAGAVG